jgi:hypothetical protein
LSRRPDGAVGRSPLAGRFERGHLTTEFNDSAAVVADSAFFGTVAAKITRAA